MMEGDFEGDYFVKLHQRRKCRPPEWVRKRAKKIMERAISALCAAIEQGRNEVTVPLTVDTTTESVKLAQTALALYTGVSSVLVSGQWVLMVAFTPPNGD